MKIYFMGILTAEEHVATLRYIQQQRNVTKVYVSKTKRQLVISVYSDPVKGGDTMPGGK